MVRIYLTSVKTGFSLNLSIQPVPTRVNCQPIYFERFIKNPYSNTLQTGSQDVSRTVSRYGSQFDSWGTIAMKMFRPNKHLANYEVVSFISDERHKIFGTELYKTPIC